MIAIIRALGSRPYPIIPSIAERQRLQGFTGDILDRNQPIFALINQMGFKVEMENESRVFNITLIFEDENQSRGRV